MVGLRGHFRGVQEPLVAHVPFAAAEENVGTLLPLHALVTEKDTEVEITNAARRRAQRSITITCKNASHSAAGDIMQKKKKTLRSLALPQKTFIKYLPRMQTNTSDRTRSSHSHQIKAKGSGSRPRLALDSPGRRGKAPSEQRNPNNFIAPNKKKKQKPAQTSIRYNNTLY